MRCYVALCSFLLLLGVVEGFPGGVEYQFHYKSRTVTGQSSVGQQFAATGAEADVIMQVTEHDDIIIQFSNVVNGYFHDEMHCDPSAPIPIQYQPLDNQHITMPFTLHLNGSRAEYMETPGEPSWITNIRKAVVNILGIPTLLGHRSNIHAFVQEEDTMAGDCYAWYTLLKLPEYQAILENQRQAIEVDAQLTGQSGSYSSSKTRGQKTRGHKTGSKTSKTRPSSPLQSPSVEPIHHDLWMLTRSLQHEACHGGFHMRIHGNKDAEESIEQSSTSQYLLRGEMGSFRLERAVVTGTVTVFPDPHDHDHYLTSITNQTLELVAVRPLQTEIPVEYQPVVRHLNFHFTPEYLPGTVPGRRPSLAEALSGVPASQQTITDALDEVWELLQALTVPLQDSTIPTSTLIERVGLTIDLLADLTQPEIEQLQTKISTNLQGPSAATVTKIFWRLVIGSGTDPAINFIIQQLSNPDTFDPEIYYFFFLNAMPTIKNPAIIPQLLNLVTEPPVGVEPIHKNIARMAVAKLIHDLCLRPDKHTSTSYTSCDTHHTCDTHQVFDTFIPALIQDFQNRELDLLTRGTALQALCNLGTTTEIHTFQNIILGTNEEPVMVRMHALYCLDAHHMPASAKVEILNFLVPIIDNIGEFPEVRSLAFLTATTWQPAKTWWHRTALSTWHEPSAQVASFITSTFTSLARSTGPLSEFAGRFVHLAKPAAPASLRHSTHLFLQEVVSKCEGGESVDIAWLASRTKSLPDHLLLRFLQSTPEFGQREVLELIVLWQEYTHTPSWVQDMNDADVSLVWEEFISLMEGLSVESGIRNIYSLPKPIINNFIFMLDLPAIFGALNPLAKGIAGHNEPSQVVPRRVRETTFIMPADNGIPIVVKFTRDIINHINLDIVQSTFAERIASHTTLELRVISPANGGRILATGITNTLSSELSLKFTTRYDPVERGAWFEVEPGRQHEMDLIHSQNSLYTVLRGHYHSQPIPQSKDPHRINTIDIAEEGEVLPDAAGISVHYSWHGDFPLSSGPLPFHRDLIWTTPSPHNWDFHLILRPQNSPTKKVLFLPLFSYRKIRVQPQVVEVEELGQVSQGASDYDYMGQTSQSGSSDYQEFGQPSDFEQQFGASPQQPDRFGRMQQEVEPVHGGWVGTVGFLLEIRGDSDSGQLYETTLTWSRSTDHRATRLVLALKSNPAQGTLDDPKALCFDLSMEKPLFPPRRHPLQPEDLHMTTSLNIQYGTSCNSGPPVMKVEGTLDVTADALAKVVADHSPECGYSHTGDWDIFTSHVFDDINFQAVWTDELPPYLFNKIQCLADSVRVWLYPYITYDHTASHTPQSVKVHATRCLRSDLWHIVTEKPNMVSHVKHLKAPFWFRKLVVPANLYNIVRHFYDDGEDAHTCVISENQVQTHDGRVYSIEPSSCWAAAIFRLSRKETVAAGPFDFSVQVRFADLWEMRLLFPWLGLYIEATRENLMLNGVLMDQSNDKFDYKRLDNGISVEIPGHVTVTITDTIAIKVANEYYGDDLRGLCGIYDGDPINDMTGPHGCLYTDPELFVHAWSTSGQGCNRFTLRANKGRVSQYQDACPHQVYQSTFHTQPNVSISCTDWVHEEVNVHGLHCTTLTKIPHCKTGCVATVVDQEMLQYKCQPTHQQQQQQQQQQQPTYQPGDDEQCRTIQHRTPVPLLCVPA